MDKNLEKILELEKEIKQARNELLDYMYAEREKNKGLLRFASKSIEAFGRNEKGKYIMHYHDFYKMPDSVKEFKIEKVITALKNYYS